MLNVQGLGTHRLILTTVPDGDPGTAETIDYARQLVAEGITSPAVRARALEYLGRYGAPSHDKLAEMRAVFQGTLDDFQFRDDPAGYEMLQTPEGMLETGVGDCDCLNAVLLPSLLGSIGFATQVITIKCDPDRPDEFSHIYMEAQDPDTGAWIALDVARSNPAFGKEPEYFWERKEWPMTSAPRYLNGYGLGAIGPTGPGMNGLRLGMGKTLAGRPAVRRFPRRGLGQDVDASDPGDTWDSGFQEGYSAASNVVQGPSNTQIFAAATPGILQGMAQVIKASNTPGIAYSGVGVPAGQQSTGTGLNISGSTWLVLAILALGGLALASKG